MASIELRKRLRRAQTPGRSQAPGCKLAITSFGEPSGKLWPPGSASCGRRAAPRLVGYVTDAFTCIPERERRRPRHRGHYSGFRLGRLLYFITN
jgi:hypothetical protein